MQDLGPAAPVPSQEELIALCEKSINDIMRTEMSDESDPDRVWILRQIHKNYLYYRDLQYFAPSMYQGLIDATGISGSAGSDEVGSGLYDYSQNIYRGYARKLEALLGNRMPNAIAIPDNADDDEAIRATRSANSAAQYIREKCELQLQNLYLVFGLFNFGTNFWHIDWEVSGDKYGYTAKPVMDPNPAPTQLGNASFACQTCGASAPADPQNPVPPPCPECQAQMVFQPPTPVNSPPQEIGTEQIENGQISISLHDGSEISVPLDSTCTEDEDCGWLRKEREWSKARCLRKWGDKLRDSAANTGHEETIASQYGEQVRSAMGSPIGLIRQKRATRWTVCDTWWKPSQYELVDDKKIRKTLQQNFPKGLRYTTVRGKVVEMKEERLQDRWVECKPEPAKRIMADPLGNDWVEVQDITNNVLNQCNEIIERSNEPGFGDPTRIDFDAYERRRDLPGELFPALRPAGGSLADIIYRPEPLHFSEQIQPFQAGVETRGQDIGGLPPTVWGGGDAEEPTARQAELKKNSALMQLGVPWMFIGKSLERVYMKGCRLLSEYQDGVISFSKKNQFGRYSTLSVVVADLRNGKFHFEADEAIPMSWGQQRDLLMWMLDKPGELLDMWGMTDPMNISEFKRLLGMPGMRVPKVDEREKFMDVIGQLLAAAPVAGQVDPATGQPGPPQPSIQPDWEDDHAFASLVAKAYLNANPTVKKDSPEGYQNLQLWGQAQDAMANQPPAPVPPKTSVAVSLKGADLGDPAVQNMLTKTDIVDPGTPVQALPPPMKMNGLMPPPGSSAPQAPPQ